MISRQSVAYCSGRKLRQHRHSDRPAAVRYASAERMARLVKGRDRGAELTRRDRNLA